MKMISKPRLALVCCMALAIGGTVSAAEPGARGPAGLTGKDLVYSYDEMFDFDVEVYLAKHAPHLKRHSESISHWAGYSSISPKVLIALMEQQSGVVSRQRPSKDALSRPFGKLSKAIGFNAQTRDIAIALRQALYEQQDPLLAPKGRVPLSGANPLQALYVRAGESHARAALLGDGEFQQVYGRLFNETRKAAPPSDRFGPQGATAGLGTADVNTLAGPENGFLEFPYPRGQSWYVGGAHTNTGSGNYPMSSLDMSLGGGWGSNQSNVWVSSSAAGSFKRHSSCFAEVVHSGGWSTTYYHMMNMQYSTGATVSKNAAIGNPANTQAQALCDGGHSTGPHEHWSLKSNGSHYHLNGVYLSGYQITATGTSYDTNCSLFYLTKNGNSYCSGKFLNPGTTGGSQTYSNTTDYTINDNATVDSPITVSGRSGNAPSNASVTVAIVHTYIGDLKVDVVAPDGSLYNIHNRSGGSADNINKTVTLNLSTEALNGTWKLRVNDNAANDVGYIDSWNVTF